MPELNNPPLQLVAFEWAFPSSASVAEGGAIFGPLQVALGPTRLELAPPINRLQGDPSVGEATLEAPAFRLVSEDRTYAVTLWRTSVVLEHTDYQHYGLFEDLLRAIATVLIDVGQVRTMQRVGLRYLDELHLDEAPTGSESWRPYVSERLLAPTSLIDGEVNQFAGGFQLEIAEDHVVNVRYGISPGPVVAAEHPLRLRNRPNTPAFMLDTDGIFQPRQPVALNSADELLTICQRVRQPSRDVFAATFTQHCFDTIFAREVGP